MKDLDPLTTLAHTITTTLEQGAQALIEQRSGYPAGGTGGSPSSTSDRTGMLATIRADKGPERSDQDYERCMYLLTELQDILNRARPPQRKQQHIAATTTQHDDGCTSCARVGTWTARTANNPMCRTCTELVLRIQMQCNITLEQPPTTLVDDNAKADASPHEKLKKRSTKRKPRDNLDHRHKPLQRLRQSHHTQP